MAVFLFSHSNSSGFFYGELKAMIDRDELDKALSVIPNTDREVWYRVGAALKTGLGDEGRETWLKWSYDPDPRVYNENSAKNTWKSLDAGRIDIGYVFNRAKEWGYSPSKTFTLPSKQKIEEQRQAAEAARQKALEVRQAEMDKAKTEAQTKYASLEPIRKLDHDYLVNKGIDERSLVRQVRREDDKLIIPMKISGEIVGLQEINKTGRKSFTKGMELKGASTVLGSWANRDKGIVLTEGYATAASIHKATGLTTIVCFAGFNLKEVASRLPKDLDVPIFIAADNDLPNKHTGKRPGLEFANAAQEVLGDKAIVIEPHFTQEDFKEFEKLYGSRPSDFNDLHKLHGLETVTKQFNEINSERNMDTNKSRASAEEAKVQGLNTLENDRDIEAETDGLAKTFQELEAKLYNPELTDSSREFEANSIAPAIDKIIDKRAALISELEELKKTEKESKENITSVQQPNASEVEQELPTPSSTEEKIDIDKELSTQIVLDHDYDHPPGQLKAKYLFTQKGEYINKQGDVLFMDKGALLKSPKQDRETVNDMLEVAKEKGWSSIQLTGTKEFKRIAYIEATSRGIEAHGYTPTEKDLAMIEELREHRSLNQINRTELTNTKGAKQNNQPSNVERQVKTEKELTKETDSGLTAAQQDAEKDKLVNQNRAPSVANIEASTRVDEHGADIPMAGVAGQEIQDELKAFMNGLTTKQQGLNKSSLAALKIAKEAVKGVVSGLSKEQQNQAIRNFNEKIDERIDGQTLTVTPNVEQTRSATPTPVKEREAEQELER